MTLAQFFPRVRTLRLGGLVVKAREWRVRDVAAAERWMESLPHPLGALDESSSDYPDRLRELYEAEWPPSFGGRSGDAALFDTRAGQARLLRITLRHSPSEILGACDALAGVLSPGQWKAVLDVAFGVREGMRSEVVARIDRHLGIAPFEAAGEEDESDGRAAMTWGEVVAGVCVKLGITPGRAGSLYLSQVHAIRLVGAEKAEERGDPVPADAALFEEVCARRWAFWRPSHEKRHFDPGASEAGGEVPGPPGAAGGVAPGIDHPERG